MTDAASSKTVLLVDTFSLFFRAFYALPTMNTAGGEPTSALYGMSALLLKLLREEQPAGVAFALDRPEPTFRHRAYPAYKGTRAPVPSELSQQLARLDDLLDALAFPRFSLSGFEADDVLATLASELEPEAQVLVASGDRDLLQLVTERVQVLFLGQRGKPALRYDRAAVQARFGIAPERLPVYVALVGDSSDNVPKVKGIGPAAAQKLASRFADVETLLAHTDELDSARLGQLVREHAEQLRASELLLKLRRDVPLPAGARHAPLTRAAALRTLALFEELEFRSLLPRLDKLTPDA